MKIKKKIREKIKKIAHFRHDKYSFLQIVFQKFAKTDCAIGPACTKAEITVIVSHHF